jgi:serine/threonine protein kinase
MAYYTRKKGGKYIARGTYGCVFGPPLKCKEDVERMDNTHISKLMQNSNAEDEYKESKSIWYKIDPTQKFSLSAIKICELDKSNLKASNEFEKCEDTNTRNALLIYKNGGLDLSKLKPHPKNYKPLFKEFLNLMKGLEIAHNNNVVHCDIKPSNIVAAIKGDNIELRFIDYGLSKDVTNLKKYDYLFITNNTYYPYWPFEFGCFNEDGDVNSRYDIMNRLFIFNNERGESSQSYSLGTINLHPEKVYELIRNTDFNNIKNIYKGLDVYSMGVVLANLLYEYFSISIVSNPNGSYYPFYYNIKTETYVRYTSLDKKTNLTEDQIKFHINLLEHIINPIIKLIEYMTDVSPNKRYTIDKAIEYYEKIIPSFDIYLNSKDIAKGLDNQLILNKKPDIPYIETPSSVLRKKNETIKGSRNLKNNSKKNNSKKTFVNLFKVDYRKLRKKTKK